MVLFDINYSSYHLLLVIVIVDAAPVLSAPVVALPNDD